jgi:hypothetical protein
MTSAETRTIIEIAEAVFAEMRVDEKLATGIAVQDSGGGYIAIGARGDGLEMVQRIHDASEMFSEEITVLVSMLETMLEDGEAPYPQDETKGYACGAALGKQWGYVFWGIGPNLGQILTLATACRFTDLTWPEAVEEMKRVKNEFLREEDPVFSRIFGF